MKTNKLIVYANEWPSCTYPAEDIPELNGVTDELRGKIETTGQWQVITKYSALAISHPFPKDHCDTTRMPLTIYGMRTLQNVRESGYQLEGKVSIDGKKVRAFTSNRIFERKDGSLINVAVLFVCN